MKKILKIAGVVFLVILGLLGLTSVALHVLLPPEKAKAHVLKHLTAHLKREVKIGEVSVGLLSGLSVSDLKVSESPDFSKGTFVSSDRFSVRLALVPLIFRKVEVKQLILDRPMIQVVRFADGKTFNFSDLLSPQTKTPSPLAGEGKSIFSLSEAHAAPAAAPAARSGEPPFPLLISNAQIHHGTVRFVDRSPAKQSLEVNSLELKLRNVSMSSPFSVWVSLNAKMRDLRAELKLAGKADLSTGFVDVTLEAKGVRLASLRHPLSGNARLKGNQEKMDVEFKTAMRSLQLKGHGKIMAAHSPNPQIQLHLESNPFPISELVEIAAVSLPAGLKVKGRAQFSADVSGTEASSRIAAKFDGKEAEIAWADKFRKPAGIPLRVAMVGERYRQTLQFQTLSAGLGAIEITGNGSLQTASNPPRFQLALKSNSFPLQEISERVPLAADYRPNGTALLDVRASGTADAPLANGSLTLQNASLHYQQSILSNLSTTVNFTQQDVAIPKLEGKLNGSDLALKMTGRRLTTQPDLSVEARLAELDLAKILPPLGSAPAASPSQSWRLAGVAWAAAPPAALPPMKLSGTLGIGRIKHDFYDAKDMDFKWNLTDVTPDLSRVSGTATFKQGAGLLKDVERLAEISRGARLALLPIVTLQKLEKKGLLKAIKAPSLQRVPFEGIRADYGLRQGVMTVKVFDLTGRDLNVNTTGTIGLAGLQPLDLHVLMKLAPGSIGGDIGELTKDEAGRPTVPFFVRGTLKNPEVKPDLRDIGRKALKKYGGDLFRGLGIGGRQPSSPPAAETPKSNLQSTTPSQPAPAPNPAKDIEKALKNIFR